MKPKVLKKGDKVAIVSLSSGVLGESFVAHEVKLLERRLNELGLEFEYMNNARKGIDYLKNHPEARADDLKQAFSDDSINMIWCAIGGDDTYLTLPYLMNDEFQSLILEHPKIFMGFSDTTNNHMMFNRLGLNTYYGPALLPDLAELSSEMLPYTASCINNLFKNNRGIELKSSPFWYESRNDFGADQVGVEAKAVREERGFEFFGPQTIVSGEILGGCIDSLYKMIKSDTESKEKLEIFSEYPIFPRKEDWKSKILCIESSDAKPAPDLFERMIKSFEQYGVFEQISAIMVGKPMDEAYYDEYRQIMFDISEKYQLPVVFNLNFGHSAPRMILPLGQIITIDSIERRVMLAESMFATDKEEEIRVILNKKVDQKRYVHSILVAKKAKELALVHHLDAEKAYLTGLAHDIAKRFSPDEERYFIEKYNLDPALLGEDAKNYRHSEIGAVAASEWFSLDKECCQAIAFHTIPSPEMTDFDKLIFLADKIGRVDMPNELAKLPELANQNLDQAMKYFLQIQELSLRERGLTQHPRTIEFLQKL